MREIQLTQGKIALVDDADFDLVSKYKWHYGNGYAKVNNKKAPPRFIRMHRLIMQAGKNQKVDHINRDTLDNRKDNLRFVTQSQNMMNMVPRKTNKSGYKGVCFVSREQKWLASTWKDNKQVWIGYFDSAKEAAKAYNDKVKELHGQYALLNNL